MIVPAIMISWSERDRVTLSKAHLTATLELFNDAGRKSINTQNPDLISFSLNCTDQRSSSPNIGQGRLISSL